MWNAQPSESASRRRRVRPTAGLVRAVVALFALAWSIAGCGPQGWIPSGKTTRLPLVVGSGTSPEQLVLAELLAQALEKSGYRVTRRFGLGGVGTIRKAMLAKSIDICWDYTGDIWTAYLGHDYPIAASDLMYLKVREEDALNQVIWLPPAQVQRNLGILVTDATAQARRMVSISDLAQSVQTEYPFTSLCAPRELYLRPTGIRGLQRVYGFRFDEASVRDASFEEGYRRLSAAECDCALGYPTESALVADGLRVLEDDEGYFLASSLVVGIRAPVLQEAPGIENVLRDLGALLTQETWSELTREIAVKGAKPSAAARRFLRRNSWAPPGRTREP